MVALFSFFLIVTPLNTSAFVFCEFYLSVLTRILICLLKYLFFSTVLGLCCYLIFCTYDNPENDTGDSTFGWLCFLIRSFVLTLIFCSWRILLTWLLWSFWIDYYNIFNELDFAASLFFESCYWDKVWRNRLFGLLIDFSKKSISVYVYWVIDDSPFLFGDENSILGIWLSLAVFSHSSLLLRFWSAWSLLRFCYKFS